MENRDNLPQELIGLLEELHAAETFLTKFLPKLALAGASGQFESLVAAHLKETSAQLDRLDRLAKKAGRKLAGGSSPGLDAAAARVRQIMEEGQKSLSRDRRLAEAAREIERYEARAYEKAVALARGSGAEEAAAVLTSTLKEEQKADRLLEELAAEIGAGSIRQEVTD